MNKDILGRIKKLENLYSVIDFDINNYINEIINPIEEFFQYEIKSRIKLSKNSYRNINELEREILSFLTIEELRKIAYCNN